MKAIVANLILGSVAYIASSNLPVLADVSSQNQNAPQTPAILSTKSLEYQGVFVLPSAYTFEADSFVYSISLEDKEYIKNVIQQDDWEPNQNIFNSTIDLTSKSAILTDRLGVSLRREPYLNLNDQEDLIFGKHHTFWQSETKQKYWGLTTVKTWGESNTKDLSLEQLDYIDSAPILAPGASTLTISGGSKQNLVKHQNTLLGKVSEFQGGVAFHQSLAEEVTVGLGFVYEDFLLGFSQFTYQPDNFPLRTSVSVLQGKEGIELHSHLKLQPSEEIVLNLYADEKDQKFDFNWGLVSGLTLIADGNSEHESLRAGAELTFNNEFFSFLAKAQLDSNNELQWRVNSKLGNFRLKYTTDNSKTNTEIKYNFNSVQESGFQFAVFFENKTRQRRKKEENLAVWGWNIHSPEKLGRNRYRWEIDLGYGFGSEGKGAIASFGAAINPSLSMKLSYEEVSLTSDETKVKLELSSD